MEMQKVQEFLDLFFEKIDSIGIDVSDFELDHVAYQSESGSDYEKIKGEFAKLGNIVSEEIVGGRRVAVFELHSPIIYKDRSIPALELVEPKEGQVCTSQFEHAEFVIEESFNEFIQKNPDLNWDTSSAYRDEFAHLKLPLGDGIQVKFHHKSALQAFGKR